MPEDERKLFVGKLPGNIQEEEIRMIFNTYGKVADVHIMAGGRAGSAGEEQKSAFVTYETVDAAQTAIKVLNTVYKFREDSPEAIHVSVARPKRDKGGGKGGKGQDDYDYGGRRYDDHHGGGYDNRGGGYDNRGYDRGYDRGYPPQDRGYDRGGYDRGGYDRGGYDRGYDRGYDNRGGYDRGGYDRGGYDRGYDRGGWDRQPSYPDRRDYDRGGYDRGPPRDDYGRDGGRGQWSNGGGKGGDRPGGKGDPGRPSPKLFVGNLPADIQKEALEMVFGTYGRIADIHIMLGRAKNGQSGAFVVYYSQEDAASAVAAMETGYEIRPGEGNIFVKYAEENKGKGKDKGGGDGRARPY